jgi:CheY-like chemotaxis protein
MNIAKGYQWRVFSCLGGGRQSVCGGGLSHLQSDEYSIFLLDVDLPDDSGIQLCDHIRAKGGTAPIIVYSGDGSYETPALKAGANGFVSMGFTLMDRLTQLLGSFESTLRV